jgi:MFS family permease
MTDFARDAVFSPEAEEHLYARVIRRFVPFLFLFYVVAYLDRVNIGFAKLEMLADLGWSDSIYGLGAGMFFLGYFVFEVPSNIILYRLGARRWLACMMVVWGFLSAGMLLVKTPEVFYGLRFALGLAEAGFFPGIIFYLTLWFPRRRRGRVTALFMTAVAISGIVGGPVSGWIMKTCHGLLGLDGWQWLFVLEGLPSVAMGGLILVVLDDSIRAARWLTEDEKALLERNLAREAGGQASFSLLETLTHGRVWLLSLVYFLFIMGLYGIGFWLPQLIKNTGVTDVFHIGLLSAIPYGVACVVMVWFGKHSDHTGERRWHIAGSAAAGTLGLILSALFAHDTAWAMAALTLATAGVLTALPIFWSLPTEFLGGTAAAAGIGLINSIGNLAGFVSPYMVGKIKDVTHSTDLGLYVIAASVALGGVVVVATGKRATRG